MRNVVLNILGGLVRVLRRTPLVRLELPKRVYYGLYSLCRPRRQVLLQLQGFKLLVDPRDEGVASFLLTTGTYEPFEADLIARSLKEGDCALDVGANIGYHSVIMARAVGPSGRIVSCEPCPDNQRLLRENLTINDLAGRAEAVPCAVGSRDGRTLLFRSDRNHGDHRTHCQAGDARDATSVRLRTLDSLIPPGTRVKLVKMDIQGSELAALQGMRRILRENEDVLIFVEFWPVALRNAGSDPREFVNLVEKERFCANVIQEGPRKLKPLSDAEFRNLAASRGEQNLLLARTPACLPVDAQSDHPPQPDPGSRVASARALKA